MDTWLDTQLQIDYAAKVAREEGKAEGVKEGVLKMAKELLGMGISIDNVSKASGVATDELMEPLLKSGENANPR